MATGQTLVNRALRLIGVIASGETPSADDSNIALEAINSMLNSWRNDRLMCYAIRDETLAMVGGTSSYTIGPSGSLNTTRPVSIEGAFMRASNIDYNVRVISQQEYNAIVDKTATSDLVEVVYYEGTMSTGTLKVWPVPTTTNVLHLQTRVPLTDLVLGTTVALPPGWEEAIATNCSIAIAPEFGTTASVTIVKMASDALKGIKGINSRPIKASQDLGALFGSRRSNIITDTP